ncbi:hypothetical protein [Pseudomonas sp. CC6-YY-74]|uniref:hypothetical protein n=1 Tax=Pseudomonas sp. CC6-YY-74 TaxID=1930532 RepID=UPI0009A1B83E|nr:hypothetical protein [Pseudomonas sp. CC6-YY-74]
METIITLDGVSHTFETKEGKTELKLQSKSTTSKDQTPEPIQIPVVWLITRRNGFPLFAVRPKQDETPFRIITADKLYSEKIQWFEPLGDNYRESIWLHPGSSKPGSEAYSAYKHFTWQQIIDFAIVDRWSVSFSKDLPGDWKANADGGADFLMVMVDNSPFWADGVGQIPFAVDTFRKYLEELRINPEAIRKTVRTGMEYGDGNPFSPNSDPTNQYDNYMVLRGALWASENFQLIVTRELLHTRDVVRTVERTSTVFQPGSLRYLQQSISTESLTSFGEWKK